MTTNISLSRHNKHLVISTIQTQFKCDSNVTQTYAYACGTIGVKLPSQTVCHWAISNICHKGCLKHLPQGPSQTIATRAVSNNAMDATQMMHIHKHNLNHLINSDDVINFNDIINLNNITTSTQCQGSMAITVSYYFTTSQSRHHIT